MIGAEVIAESIVARGLSRVFVYPGGTIAPILDELRKRGVETFCARHEQGAAYAALAVARITGEPQVVMVTSGPGVTNVMTPVADAFFDSTPLVVLSGQVGAADMRGDLPVRQRGFQEVDATALMAPVTKKQLLPLMPDDVPATIDAAFAVAKEGRPGPVLVDLPMSSQRGTLSTVSVSSLEKHLASVPDVDDDAVSTLAAWILEARRPVVIAGQGVLISGAEQELRDLVLGAGIPVSASLLGLGAIPTDSELALGFHGHTGNQCAGMAIHSADLVIAVGSRLDVRQTGSVVAQFAPQARIVRIDLDAAELAHSRVRVDLSMQADAKSALRALNAKLAGKTMPDRAAWHAQVAGWKKQHVLTYSCGDRICPQTVIETANRLTAGRPLSVISGVGSHQQWAARHFDFDSPRRSWLTSGGHGAMGYDLPTAMGAAIARPGVPAICFVGDGSLQMNIQELATIAEHQMNVKIIVLDNHRLAMVSQFQNLNWGSDPTCGNKWNPDFAAVAQSYGIPSASAVRPEEVEATLMQVFATDGPFLAHFVVDPDQNVVPMLLADQTMDAMWNG